MSRRGWVLFSAMCLIWGIPYLLIKVAVEELAPSTLVLARTAIAAAILLPVAAARGHLRPLLPKWRWLLIFSVVEVCVPWWLLGFAEQRLSSSLTGLLIAAVPLVGAVLAMAGADHERLDARRLTGLLLGLGGVLALVGLDLGVGDARAAAAVGVVAICYATGPIILARKLGELPGLGVVAASLGIAAVAYLPAGLAQAPGAWPAGDTVAAVIALALVCTALAFLVFFALIAEVGPIRATVFTYVNPAVAVLLGVIVLDEAFSSATALGFVLILGGSVLATARTRRPRRRPEPAAVGVDLSAERVAQCVPEP
ncbi:MAG: DMT family transporter [Actinomycetes bacterium]